MIPGRVASITIPRVGAVDRVVKNSPRLPEVWSPGLEFDTPEFRESMLKRNMHPIGMGVRRAILHKQT